MRYKVERKSARIANLRNRLRAVGLSNLQLTEELCVARVNNAAYRGSNNALQFRVEELQRELKTQLERTKAIMHEMFDLTPRECEIEDHNYDDPPITLQDLYSDEMIEETEKLPETPEFTTRTPPMPPMDSENPFPMITIEAPIPNETQTN